ncbi:uncharacterized protein C2845_PM06G05410 [Panicum miliaceum]|uniref:FLZ-type domain-containing protein n=1 Tax=Panicum miliaceum TaxID=4540 RepID=A0A3L6RF52_PANMI|nr:uncharacterized protein C2845_PM06G05410 [Panicum miliaceum]
MLLRRVAADDGAGAGAGVGRPRLFAVPRLLVGLGAPKCGGPDCDSPTAARSPTSPLDLRPFAALGGSLLRSPRSPRSWDSHRVGLGGLVDDALAEPAPGARNRLLGPQMRQPFKLPQRLTKSFTTQPRDCGQAASPVLGNVGTAAGAGASTTGKPVPCSRSYGDVKSGPEVIVPGGGAQPGASRHPADLGKFRASGSLPASIGGPRRYIRSVSATEVEQSEDYTCIIAHGPNPKTTRIFGDCILEPCTVESMDTMEVKEGAESYWLVKCFDDGEVGEEFQSSCVSCKKKLDGNDSCIYRGEKAFCSGNCRDNEILPEEDENSAAISSLSSAGSSSSFNDDIFMAEMVVLTAPVDVHLP